MATHKIPYTGEQINKALANALAPKPSHKHNTEQLIRANDTNRVAGLSPIDQVMIDRGGACRTAFMPAEAIKVEYSTDGGASWKDYGMTAENRIKLFSMTRDMTAKIGGPATENVTTNMQMRITIEPLDRYAQVDSFYCWMSSGGHKCVCDIEASTIGAKTTFVKIRDRVPIDGWSGNNIINMYPRTFGGGANQTTNTYAYRFTFTITSINSAYIHYKPTIADLRMYGASVWRTPEGNSMMDNGHMYNWRYDKTVVFANPVEAPTAKVGTNNTQVATTAFVKNAVDTALGEVGKLLDTLNGKVI